MSFVVNPALLTQAKQLTPADRLELIEELWQSLNPDEFPVTAAEKSMLDERLADLAENPSSGRSWEDVEADLQQPLS
jgi:putative addiction module component (TIGR02574 family)